MVEAKFPAARKGRNRTGITSLTGKGLHSETGENLTNKKKRTEKTTKENLSETNVNFIKSKNYKEKILKKIKKMFTKETILYDLFF